MKGDINDVLKAPTEPVLDFATLQEHLREHYFYASDKEDGIRCIIHPRHGPVSRTMKVIPNNFVRDMLWEHCPTYLDGELLAVTTDFGEELGFNETQSAIMSEGGIPRFIYKVFDCFENIYNTYEQRMQRAKMLIRSRDGGSFIQWLPHYRCNTVEDIERHERSALERGKEGIMLNHCRGWYKEGRSTLNEGYLLKVKRFVDDEAIVVGVEEEMENCNLATRDAAGRQKRSKHKANLVGKMQVGRLICKWKGYTIKIGSGMTHEQKQDWWDDESRIVGQRITFKYQAHGMKLLPRAPIFKGIRHD